MQRVINELGRIIAQQVVDLTVLKIRVRELENELNELNNAETVEEVGDGK